MMPKGKHDSKSKEQIQAESLDSTIRTLTRIRNELDPRYVPCLSDKKPNRFVRFIRDVNMWLDAAAMYALAGLVCVAGMYFAWLFIAPLLGLSV